MPELETRLRDARPEWPEPSSGAEARTRAALGFAPAPRSPRGWLARTTRTRGARLLIPAALLLTAGAAVAATLISTGGSGTTVGRPAALDFGAPEVAGEPVGTFDAGPSVAVDARGVVTVAWTRAGRVVVSSRARGGRWSPAARLSDPAKRAAYPRVGVDDDGRVTVTWRERTAAERVVRRFRLPSGAPAGALTALTGQRWAVVARTRPAGGEWSASERLSDDTSSARDLEDPGLVVEPGGRTVVSWDAGGSMWSRIRPAGAAWGPVVRVGGDDGEAVDPQLATSPSGGAILTWSNRIGEGFRYRYAIRAAVLGDGAWEAASVVDGRAVNRPLARGALGPDGAAAVVWMSEGLDRTETFASAWRAGDWTPAARIEASRGLFGIPATAAVGDDGRAVLLSGSRGVAATLGPDGRWTPLALAPIAGRAVGLAAYADASGRVITVRGALRRGEVMVQSVGGAAVTIRARMGGPVAAASGRDGTTAIAWAAGTTRRRVSVTVAEGSG